MQLKLTLLAAAAAAGLWSTAPMAQHTSNPTGTYMDSVPYGTWTGGPTHSPNTMYVYPSGTTYMVPTDRTVIYEPTVSRRGMSHGHGPTHTPNPNRVQNNGVPTQY